MAWSFAALATASGAEAPIAVASAGRSDAFPFESRALLGSPPRQVNSCAIVERTGALHFIAGEADG
jgi:hypothetical protein